jgi:G:T-mismatch repair DNA endonuclease (very short patch repair protein)
MTEKPDVGRSALGFIKYHLGLAGRGDFYTHWPGVPADIVYPEERLAIFVLPCFFYGCSRHDHEINESWKRRVRHSRHQLALTRKEMQLAGWSSVRIFECAGNQHHQNVVRRIIEALAESGSVTAGYLRTEGKRTQPEATRARLAKIDAQMTVSAKEWELFVEAVEHMNQSPHWRERDLRLALVVFCKIPEGAAQRLIAIAVHHGVIRNSPKGFCVGKVFEHALADIGREPKGEHERIRWEENASKSAPSVED